MPNDMPLADLTPEEEAEFTAINAVAFDLLGVEDQNNDKRSPMWLCLCQEEKDRVRMRARDFTRGAVPSLIFEDDAGIDSILQQKVPQTFIDRWRTMERHFKYLRTVEQNPKAFFRP